MTIHRRPFVLFAPLALLLAVTVLPAQENLELGKMWTFEDAPLEYLEAVYGFTPSQEWLDGTRLASLRMTSGCSASFVSPRGLVLTNHHCVRAAVANVSPDESDWVKNGYVARSLAEEVKLPGTELEQLVAMSDVTDRMNAGISPQDDVDSIAKKRDANREQILEEARESEPDLRHQVVSLYHGGKFHLYQYRRYGDVRLCLAPHLQTAHFGGDPDNFTYPRYGIDFALLRVYEDDRPLDSSENFFSWSRSGAAEGELVFVTGNPGSTGRLNTLAQLEYLRDVEYPIRLRIIREQLELLEEAAKAGPEAEKRFRTPILSLENSNKAITGYLSGLEDEELMAHKTRAERQFRARVNADPDMKTKYGSAWDELADVAQQKRASTPLSQFQTASYSRLLERAVALVEAVDPAADEDARERAARRARNMRMSESELRKRWQTLVLHMAVDWLPKNDPFLEVFLGGRTPEEAMAHLYESSRMDDREHVAGLLEGGYDAVVQSDDPALETARVLAPLIAANGRVKKRLEREEEVQLARIGQAIYYVYGSSVSPDATFTLRLSDGVVKGFPMNGTIAPPATSFYGLYARNCEFNDEYPFNLPQIWLDRKGEIDMTKRVDFVSTNDIIGGNSGSPVINARREIVGVVFDGNIQMLPNRFLYRDDVPRSVSVHSDAIIEAMTKIYEAGDLVAELRGTGGYDL